MLSASSHSCLTQGCPVSLMEVLSIYCKNTQMKTLSSPPTKCVKGHTLKHMFTGAPTYAPTRSVASTAAHKKRRQAASTLPPGAPLTPRQTCCAQPQRCLPSARASCQQAALWACACAHARTHTHTARVGGVLKQTQKVRRGHWRPYARMHAS